MRATSCEGPSLVTGLGVGPKLRPVGLRDLGGEVAHPVGQATLPLGSRKALLDRADQTWRSIRRHQEWILESPTETLSGGH